MRRIRPEGMVRTRAMPKIMEMRAKMLHHRTQKRSTIAIKVPAKPHLYHLLLLAKLQSQNRNSRWDSRTLLIILMLLQAVVGERIPAAAKSQPIYVFPHHRRIQLRRLRAHPVVTPRVRAMTAGANLASMMSMRWNHDTNMGLKMMDMVMDLRNMDTRSMELRRATVMIMVRQRTMAMDTVMEVVDMGMITEMALMILTHTHITATCSSNKL